MSSVFRLTTYDGPDPTESFETYYHVQDLPVTFIVVPYLREHNKACGPEPALSTAGVLTCIPVWEIHREIYAAGKIFPHQYESICCSKVPFMLNKAIHSCQVKCRDYAYKPYVRPRHEDHDHKNMRLKRPMSPHLTIYAPCLPAMTSITQRITGVIITFYAIMLSGGALFLSNGIDSYVSMIQSLNLNRFFIFIIKILVGFPFGYHYFCGIRFCLFNVGKLMEIKLIYSSARQAIIAAAVLSFLFALR